MKKILFFLLISTAALSQPYNGVAVKTTGVPDGNENAIIVKNTPQIVDRISFAKVLSGSVDSDWGTIVGSIGTGMAVNQTGGNLVVTSGTTARSETIIRSTNFWDGGIRLRARLTLSQRIVNNNFFVELVDVIGDGLAYTISSATVIVVTFPSGHGFTSENVGQSMYLGGFSGTGTFLSGRYPIASISGDDITFTVSGFAAGTGTCSAFGWNYYQLQYQGTTATAVNYDTQRKGWANGVTAATINTTASPGHLAIITGNDLTSVFADQLVASGATVAVTPRASRAENVPDDVNLRLQIRIANGSTAPASTTTLTIGLVSVANFAGQDVVLQDIRPMTVATGLPVDVVRTVVGPTQPVSGTLTAVTTVTTLANGQTAHSAASTGSPLRMAGRVSPTTAATQETTLVAGDAADVGVSTNRQLIIKPYETAENDWQSNNLWSNTTTAQTFKAASGTANIRNYVTGIQVGWETLGAATELSIRDGASGTVIWRTKIGTPAGYLSIQFPTPLKGTANTLLEVVTTTASITGAVYFNAQGYTGF